MTRNLNSNPALLQAILNNSWLLRGLDGDGGGRGRAAEGIFFAQILQLMRIQSSESRWASFGSKQPHVVSLSVTERLPTAWFLCTMKLVTPPVAGDQSFMQIPSTSLPCLGLAALTALALSAQPSPAQTKGNSTTLYNLNTQCSLKGGQPQACVVEAIQEGDTTLYRHKIGSNVETVRITDNPVRMSIWDAKTKTWQNLSSAGARFSTNSICFNGRDLCVVNANYLNSVREERPDATAGRDLVQVRFDDTGRVNLTCYDDGCKEVR